jgi:two-component system, response regulator, stage 0 sporulation protein F
MNARIAIVDDSEDFRRLMEELLREDGHEVVSLTESDDLIGELVRARPDAILLDLLIASARGSGSWDRLRRIRSHPSLRGVPVLVCTGDVLSLRDKRADIERDPLLASLEKPFSIDQLERAVRHLIGHDPMPEWDDDRDLVLVADQDARLVHASAAMLTLLGLGADALVQRRVSDIVVHDASWTKREWERYVMAKRWEGSVTLRTGADQALPAHARASIVETRGSTGTCHASASSHIGPKRRTRAA